jgi:signal transduction histidine kinase
VVTNTKLKQKMGTLNTASTCFPEIRHIMPVILITVVIALGWIVRDSHTNFVVAEEKYDKISKLQGTIAFLDEALAMSVRMAAATGQTKWESRYRDLKPKLDAALKQVISQAPQDFILPATFVTNSGGNKLTAMENEAFDFVRTGNTEAASKLLNSREYGNQKRIYNGQTGQHTNAIKEYLKTKSNRLHIRVLGAVTLFSATVPLLLFALFPVLRTRKDSAAQKQTTAERQTPEGNLQERTKELNCIYKIADSVRKSQTLDDMLHNVVELIPEGWHCGDITHVRIQFDDIEYGFEPSAETVPVQKSDIIIDGNKRGFVEVYCAGQKPAPEEMSHLEEKRNFIDAVTHLLSESAAHKTAAYEIKTVRSNLNQATQEIGRGQMATDVLHNVSNVLNSINVTASVVNEKVSNSEVPNLKKVTDIMNAHHDDLATFLTNDPHGSHVPLYLAEVADVLVNEQVEIIEKLRSLSESVNHVKEIVKTQQSYAKMSGVEEPTNLAELIQNAIKINYAGLGRHNVTVANEIDDQVGEVNVDQQKVLQVLVNLIGNAKYALAGTEKEQKVLTLRLYKHGGDKVRIEVADNGEGISPENMQKIFDRGFTTKKDGHGFGLHSGVLAAEAMGGSLTVHSEGTGKGATFRLELPLSKEEIISNGRK